MTRILSTSQAIREGMLQAADEDKNVIFMAEGVKEPTGFFGTLMGLDKEIGEERLIEMPIAENGMIGIAIGAAIAGKKVIISLQRVEFAMLALEQIFNNAAKARYVSNGKHNVPIVIRLVIGRGWGQGPEHSQSLESMFAMFPGLKVVMPVYPSDSKGLIIGSIEDGNPVIFIEHRWCHYVQGEVVEDYYSKPLKDPIKICDGDRCTIIATAYSVLEAFAVARILKKYDINIEIFDLSILRPLNILKIKESLSKTKKIITIDTGNKFLGIGAEIVSQICEDPLIKLEANPIRLGLPDHPTPSSRNLIEYQFYPNMLTIFEAIDKQIHLKKSIYESIKKEILHSRSILPNDIPNPEFKGPF